MVVLGPWYLVLGGWSDPGPWSQVLSAAGPGTMGGQRTTRTDEAPSTKYQGPATRGAATAVGDAPSRRRHVLVISSRAPARSRTRGWPQRFARRAPPKKT